MHLEISYAKPLLPSYNSVYVGNAVVDGGSYYNNRSWAKYNGVAKETLWFSIGKVLKDLGNVPMTKADILKHVQQRYKYLESNHLSHAWCMKSPDEWATFNIDLFLVKFKKGNKFTYKLSEGGLEKVIDAEKIYDAEFARLQKKFETAAKTKEEAIDKHHKAMAVKMKKEKIKEIKKAGLTFDGNF